MGYVVSCGDRQRCAIYALQHDRSFLFTVDGSGRLALSAVRPVCNRSGVFGMSAVALLFEACFGWFVGSLLAISFHSRYDLPVLPGV
jgi:hypothetical protein